MFVLLGMLAVGALAHAGLDYTHKMADVKRQKKATRIVREKMAKMAEKSPNDPIELAQKNPPQRLYFTKRSYMLGEGDPFFYGSAENPGMANVHILREAQAEAEAAYEEIKPLLPHCTECGHIKELW